MTDDALFIEIDEIISRSDMARMAGVGQPAVWNWQKRFADTFPKPFKTVGKVELYRKSDFIKWYRTRYVGTIDPELLG